MSRARFTALATTMATACAAAVPPQAIVTQAPPPVVVPQAVATQVAPVPTPQQSLAVPAATQLAATPCEPVSTVAESTILAPGHVPPAAVVQSPAAGAQLRAAVAGSHVPLGAIAAVPHDQPPSAAAIVPHAEVPPAVAVVPHAEVAPAEPCPPTQSPDEQAVSSGPLPDLPPDPVPQTATTQVSAPSGVGTARQPLNSDLFWHVINNSNRSLYCAFKLPGAGQAWQDWEKIAPAEDWGNKVPNRSAWFQCYAPVKKGIYALVPGRRYSLLPAESGPLISFADIGPAQ